MTVEDVDLAPLRSVGPSLTLLELGYKAMPILRSMAEGINHDRARLAKFHEGLAHLKAEIGGLEKQIQANEADYAALMRWASKSGVDLQPVRDYAAKLRENRVALTGVASQPPEGEPTPA